jgi:hypothetical protein
MQQWQFITDDPWVLQCARGHHLEFESFPIQTSLPHPIPFDELERKAIDLEIATLLKKGAISQVEPIKGQFIANIFTVAKKDTIDKRTIINLKPLNKFITYKHFKMEGLHMVKDLLRLGDRAVKIDLSDAYLTVPMGRKFRKYLRFYWNGILYQYNCLPFGLASAPRVFTKILKPVVGFLRALGIRMIIYLDDILIVAASDLEAREHAAIACSLLESLGYRINVKKSDLEPKSVIEFLGLQICIPKMMFVLPVKKVTKIHDSCLHLFAANSTNSLVVRDVCKVVGFLVSATPAIHHARLHLRHLQTVIIRTLEKSHQNYEAPIFLDMDAMEDLRFWTTNLSDHNGQLISPPPPDAVLFTDASDYGWGAVLGSHRTGGRWSLLEKRTSINVRELRAAMLGISAFQTMLQGKSLLLRMDNQTAVAYVNKQGGTKSEMMTDQARGLFQVTEPLHITLSADYIPGVENTDADWMSRHTKDYSQWKLDPRVFLSLNKRFGPFSIDLFADRHNHQLPKFLSWRPDPKAFATDAFLHDWSSETCNYAFPPFALIGQIIRKLQLDQADLLLVAPAWSAQHWFALLPEVLCQLPAVLPWNHQLLTGPEQEVHPLVTSRRLHLVGWKLSGDVTKVRDFHLRLSKLCCPVGVLERERIWRARGRSGVAGVWNGIPIPFQPL